MPAGGSCAGWRTGWGWTRAESPWGELGRQGRGVAPYGSQPVHDPRCGMPLQRRGAGCTPAVCRESIELTGRTTEEEGDPMTLTTMLLVAVPVVLAMFLLVGGPADQFARRQFKYGDRTVRGGRTYRR